MASRAIADLLPDVRHVCAEWLEACRRRGTDVLIYCTFRSPAEQASLYAQGRTLPGRIVTNAAPGQSWHQYRRAWDAVPIVHGKPDWSFSETEDHWRVMVEEARRLGIEWAGDWRTFQEYVHFQITGGLTLEQAAQSGRMEV